MRFSSVFHLPLPQRLASEAPAPARAEEPAVPVLPMQSAPAELPEDLDQRVRMIGEWQLGEA
jgi:hypothetical protein